LTARSTLERGLRLNLGCGGDVIEGYDGVDIVPGPSVRFVCNLNERPWPFPDNSVREVLMYNLLEHLNDTVSAMEELHRILEPSGTVTIQVPYYNSYGAATDPTHRNFFSEDTMNYFTIDGATQHSVFNYYSVARFRIVSRVLHQRSGLLRKLPEKAQLFLGHHLATISDVTWVLQAVK
jgi:hypothetical protein